MYAIRSYYGTFVRPIALLIIVSSRSINSLIWALLLVAIVGPGVFAGILAIGLRSIGFVAKLLYEAIEEIDEGQVEAVTATGASPAQVVITSYSIHYTKLYESCRRATRWRRCR